MGLQPSQNKEILCTHQTILVISCSSSGRWLGPVVKTRWPINLSDTTEPNWVPEPTEPTGGHNWAQMGVSNWGFQECIAVLRQPHNPINLHGPFVPSRSWPRFSNTGPPLKNDIGHVMFWHHVTNSTNSTQLTCNQLNLCPSLFPVHEEGSEHLTPAALTRPPHHHCTAAAVQAVQVSTASRCWQLDQ